MTGAERISIQERAREVADELVSRCVDLYEVAHEAECDDIDFCRALDEYVFFCEGCHWWSSSDELHDFHTMLCEECADVSGGDE
jgi:hypothetical protein